VQNRGKGRDWVPEWVHVLVVWYSVNHGPAVQVQHTARGASSCHSVAEPRLSAFMGLPTAGCSTGGIRPRWPGRAEVRELLMAKESSKGNGEDPPLPTTAHMLPQSSRWAALPKHLSAGQIVCRGRKQLVGLPPPPACDRRAPALPLLGYVLNTHTTRLRITKLLSELRKRNANRSNQARPRFGFETIRPKTPKAAPCG
jgi:hypothetical protein